jgi:hypothetical protein
MERHFEMRNITKLGFFLVLILLSPGMLGAQDEAAKPESVSASNSESRSVFESAAKSAALPKVAKYEQLLTAIRGARKESRVRVEKAVEQERVREAWEIGRLIDEHILQHKERADYGAGVLERLSIDLGMSRTELSYMLQFAKAYPILRTSENLTWSHYESLLALNDAKQREEVESLASREKWPLKKLREEVRNRKAANNETQVPDAPETLTPPEMGQAGTYKIILAKTGPYKGELALDLGFSNYYRLSEVLGENLSAYKEGDLVVFYGKEVQVLGGVGGSNIEHLRYTYHAWVSRVLDGDTFEAVVDLGFGITTTQTLRLRGVDAPEIVTKDGQEAKQFVEGLLQPGTPVFIKTSRSDKYDRYLVDVFVADPASGEEKFLNGLLLEKGHAVIVQS